MEGQHQMLRVEAEKIEGKRDVQQAKPPAQFNSAAAAASPPPSASSSPSHEFSFTISLHPSSTANISADNKTKSPPPPFAIDLSPADEIFFHGHLLPLHLLSHLPVSPRSSTNSMDSFTLPIKELLHDDNNNNNNSNNSKTSSSSSDEYYYNNNNDIDYNDHDLHHRRHSHQESRHVLEGKGRGKSKSFSLFGIPKWRKGCHDQGRDDDDQHTTQKRKSKFELFKRYMRFVKPFLSLRNKRGTNDEFLRQQPYSYSGNLKLRSKKELRGRRGEFSAPASMRTSPTNSGLLVASGTVTPTTTSDSTMEELQAAIQAAIAHCKKSIAATDEKIKAAAITTS